MDAREDRPAAAHAGEIVAREPHQQAPQGLGVSDPLPSIGGCGEVMITNLIPVAETGKSLYKPHINRKPANGAVSVRGEVHVVVLKYRSAIRRPRQPAWNPRS